MFRITKDPPSGSSIQYLAKITAMGLSCLQRHSRQCSTHTVPLQTVQYTHTRITGKYAAITPTTSISTDTMEPSL